MKQTELPAVKKVSCFKADADASVKVMIGESGIVVNQELCDKLGDIRSLVSWSCRELDVIISKIIDTYGVNDFWGMTPEALLELLDCLNRLRVFTVFMGKQTLYFNRHVVVDTEEPLSLSVEESDDD